MSPTFPLLIFFLSCLCFFSAEKKVTKHKNARKHSTEQAKNRKSYKVKHKNRFWKIKTTNEEGEKEHHGGQLGGDYQDSSIQGTGYIDLVSFQNTIFKKKLGPNKLHSVFVKQE